MQLLWSLTGRIFLLTLVMGALPTACSSSNIPSLRHYADELDAPSERRDLIVSGIEALPNEFPWFASMLRSSRDEQPGCGGTLVSPDRVLTAAHCMIANRFVPELGPPAYVRIGHTTHTDGEAIPVDCVTIHPNYIGRYNDLAIVKLAKNVSTPFVTLNNNKNYPSMLGQELTVVGFGAPWGKLWGILGIFGTLWMRGQIPKTRRLQKLSTYFVTQQECRKNFACVDRRYHTCAKANSEAGICYGDSGGPLLDSHNVQVGVTTGKTGDSYACAAGFPDAYVPVSQYYDWIQSEIDSDTCSDFIERAFTEPCEE